MWGIAVGQGGLVIPAMLHQHWMAKPRGTGDEWCLPGWQMRKKGGDISATGVARGIDAASSLAALVSVETSSAHTADAAPATLRSLRSRHLAPTQRWWMLLSRSPVSGRNEKSG